MQKAIINIALIITILFSIPLTTLATSDTLIEILQSYVIEQTTIIFFNIKLRSETLKCVISKLETEIMETGLLSDGHTQIKTTILVDISKSIPKTMRNNVIETLKKLVENKSENEELSIYTFGNELNIYCGFSSDRNDLMNAIDKIKFSDNHTIIYDAIYNTIPQISRKNDNNESKAIFYRTVVITDGVDDTVSGITKEELFIRLQNERYPVYVVAVSGKETGVNKELAAIVRMSGSKYYMLNPDTDISTLALLLNMGDIYYFIAKAPIALLDGTTRQVDISDGINQISIDVKFPVYNATDADVLTGEENKNGVNDSSQPEVTSDELPIVAISEMPSEEEQTTTTFVTTTQEPASDTTLSNSNSSSSPNIHEPVSSQSNNNSVSSKHKTIGTLFGDYTIMIFVVFLIALSVIAATVFLALTAHVKKKKAALSLEFRDIDDYSERNFDKTEYVSSEEYEKYVQTKYTIKLSNPNNSDDTWTLSVVDDLLIGRADYCHVRFDEKSVSREQCKIAVQGMGLVVIHISLTNKTILNGSAVIESAPLKNGDLLKFGRQSLLVDYIEKLDKLHPKQEPLKYHESEKTESMF